MLLPIRMPPIRRSCWACSRLTILARRFPSLASWCIRGRDAPVRAVSDPEKNPESASKTMIAMMVRMMGSLMWSGAFQRSGRSGHVVEKYGDVREVNFIGQERVPDASDEHESNAAGLYLLVAPHMLQQGCGIPLA